VITFVISLVILVGVVGPLATWAILAERRKVRALEARERQSP
jgi:hypothetical protein